VHFDALKFRLFAPVSNVGLNQSEVYDQNGGIRAKRENYAERERVGMSMSMSIYTVHHR